MIQKKANKASNRGYYKPGEKRKELKTKYKQDDSLNIDDKDSFPQLGANSSAPKTIKSLRGGKTTTRGGYRETYPKKNDVIPTSNNEAVEEPEPKLKHKESAPVEPTQPKLEIPYQNIPAASSPQPAMQSSPNFPNSLPLQMPMHPGMMPNMMHMPQNQNIQMPYMGQMVMMMPTQMGMRPTPFMMPPHMNQPNFNQFNPNVNFANTMPPGVDNKGFVMPPGGQPLAQNK